MKHFSFFLLGAMLVAAVPVTATNHPELTVELGGSAVAAIDLLADQGKQFEIIVEVQSPANGVAITMTSKLGQVLQFNDVSENGLIWTKSVDVDLRDFTTGEWSIVATISNPGGAVQTTAFVLDVTATGAPALALIVDGAKYTAATTLAEQELNKQAIFNLQYDLGNANYLLQYLAQTVDGEAGFLNIPYLFSVGQESESTQEISFLVRDRALRTVVVTIPVVLDFTAPEITASVGPAFGGLPALLNVTIIDKLDHTTVVTYNETIHSNSGDAFNRSLAMPLSAVGTNVTVVIQSTDSVGNTASKSILVPVQEPKTEVKLESFQADQDAYVIGETVTLTANYNQSLNIIEVPLEATINSTSVDLAMANGVVPKNGSLALTWQVEIGRGVHNFSVHASIPDLYNQTGAIDNGTLEVEVFIGKVIRGADVYYIRGNELGLPLEAVQGDNVFQLNLEDMQNTQVYRINGTEAYWHDSNVVTIIEEPTSTSESSTKETPAPFALLLVALALLARRR